VERGRRKREWKELCTSQSAVFADVAQTSTGNVGRADGYTASPYVRFRFSAGPASANLHRYRWTGRRLHGFAVRAVPIQRRSSERKPPQVTSDGPTATRLRRKCCSESVPFLACPVSRLWMYRRDSSELAWADLRVLDQRHCV